MFEVANVLDTLKVDVGKLVVFIPATYGVLNYPGCPFATSCSSQAVKTCLESCRCVSSPLLKFGLLT